MPSLPVTKNVVEPAGNVKRPLHRMEKLSTPTPVAGLPVPQLLSIATSHRVTTGLPARVMFA
jgi:hypothetical protein